MLIFFPLLPPRFPLISKRSVSLEKKQLQGLLGKIDSGGMTSPGNGNPMEGSGAGVKGEGEDIGEMESEEDAAAAETAVAVAEAVVDPDTDETDKEVRRVYV